MVDLSWVAAGPWCARYLATLGAEVIKIESGRRLDFTRTSGPWSDKGRGHNKSGYFNLWNQCKRSCTINLSRREGAEVAKGLIAVSDMVIENFSFGTMERLGLGYPTLRSLRPDLIMVSVSGFGRTGPEKTYLAYGRNIHAASGLSYLTGYCGGPPGEVKVIWGDSLSGTAAAFAAMFALYHRLRTGRGQYIDLAMVEALAMHLPEAFIDYSMNGREGVRTGNLSETMAPHNCYRCLGDDRWVTIGVKEDQWRLFCKALGDPQWCREDRFATLRGRLSNREELDRLVEEWTRQRTNEKVAKIMQHWGIAAGPTADLKDLLGDPFLYERGTLVEVDHPEVGPRVGPGLPWRMSGVPSPRLKAAPLLGQDNEYVFCQLLGMSRREVESLTSEGILS